MQPTYFDFTVPVFIKNLTNLKTFLERGWVAAREANMSESDFLSQSLAPDMFHLKRQIQIATDSAKGAAARLTGAEPLKIEDTEETVDELLKRIDTVVAYLANFTPEQFADAAKQHVTLPYIPDQYQLGADYVVDFVLPNFFFHVAIAYAIVRAQGVALGKQDFIGGLKLHPVT